jgi:hypothetical protein
MEQRIGRVDRVNSETERRLKHIDGELEGEAKLQVFYPHLRETVERLQVERVIERMNRFLRLMHKDLGQPEGERKQVNVAEEILRIHRDLAPILEPLESAFPIREELLRAPAHALAVAPDTTRHLLDRFRRVAIRPFDGLDVDWESNHPEDALMGTVRMPSGRQQPFTLVLRSLGGRLLVRCVSPIGRLDDYDRDQVGRYTWLLPVQIGAIYDPTFETYNLNVEREVLLGPEGHDRVRIETLIKDVIEVADRLEADLLQKDEPFSTFREDLDRESDDA